MTPKSASDCINFVVCAIKLLNMFACSVIVLLVDVVIRLEDNK